MRGLAAVALAALVVATAAYARPAGKPPVARLQAIVKVVQDWRKTEENLRLAVIHHPGDDHSAAVQELKERMAIVDKELRKAKAAGLKETYLKLLQQEIGRAKELDGYFITIMETGKWPSGYNKEIGSDMFVDWGQGGKLGAVGWAERIIKGAPGGDIDLRGTEKKITAAVEAEEKALENWDKDKIFHGSLRSSQDDLDGAANDIHRAEDRGQVTAAQEEQLVGEIDEILAADDAADRLLVGRADALRKVLLKKFVLVDDLGRALAKPPATALTPTPSKPTTTPAATTPKPTGKVGPACEAGHWSSPTLAIANPESGSSALYSFVTPIPNHDYYNGKHGFTTGGCDFVGGKLQVNIDVIGSDGKLAAWDYQFGTFPSGKQFSDGTDCPYTDPQTNAVKNVCTLQNPRLGVQVPKQGFVPPQNFTQDRSDFKDLAVLVPALNRLPPVGTGGSISVKISWQPKK